MNKDMVSSVIRHTRRIMKLFIAMDISLFMTAVMITVFNGDACSLIILDISIAVVIFCYGIFICVRMMGPGFGSGRDKDQTLYLPGMLYLVGIAMTLGTIPVYTLFFIIANYLVTSRFQNKDQKGKFYLSIFLYVLGMVLILITIILSIMVGPFMAAIMGLPVLACFTASHVLHMSIQKNILEMWSVGNYRKVALDRRGIGKARTLPKKQNRRLSYSSGKPVVVKEKSTKDFVPEKREIKYPEDQEQENVLKPRVLAPPPGHSRTIEDGIDYLME